MIMTRTNHTPEAGFNRNTAHDTDIAIGKLLKQELPQAPADEWFTRKVMNRLPEKRNGNRTSMPEKICYILGILTLIATWIYAIIFTGNNGLTQSSLVMAVTLPVVTLFCITIFALPAIRRNL